MIVNESKYAYIAPTYKMAKNVAWDILKKHAGMVDGVTFNESELRCDFKNKSRITLYGADNPDSLRGIGLWGVIFDEYSQQPSNIFTEIVRPSLADHKGYAIWIGTPKGKNEFYRLYETAKEEEGWLALLLKAEDTHLISAKELEDSRKVMSLDEFEQEFNCSFEASIKGAYYAQELQKMREENRIKDVPYDTALQVHTVWDLGVGTNLAIGFYQAIANEVRMIDYWEGDANDGIQHAAIALQGKNYVYGKHFAPHDINARDMQTGKTRITLAQDLGINFEVVPMLKVKDGIELGRRLFSRLWVDQIRCAVWLDAMGQYRQEWDDNKGMFKDNPLHDWTSHKGDVHRYAATISDQMINNYGELKFNY